MQCDRQAGMRRSATGRQACGAASAAGRHAAQRQRQAGMRRSATSRDSAPECSLNCAASTVQSEVPACSACRHHCVHTTWSGARLQCMPASQCALKGIRPGGTQSRAPVTIGVDPAWAMPLLHKLRAPSSCGGWSHNCL